MAKILTLLLVCFSAFGQTLSVINTGTTSNDGTGDSLRTAFTKANTNFYQLWSEVFTNIPVDIANASVGKLNATNGTAVNLTGSLTNVSIYGGTVIDTGDELQDTVDYSLALTPSGNTPTENDASPRPRSVATIASLVSDVDPLLVPTYARVSVLGYATAGDGGGGDFRRVLTSSGSTNTGTFFTSTANATYAWERVAAGDASVRWFGAIGDGATDDSAEWHAAIQYAQSAGVGLFVPSGSYLLTNSVVITNSLAITFDPQAEIVLSASGVDYSALTPQSGQEKPAILSILADNVTVTGFRLNGGTNEIAAIRAGEDDYVSGSFHTNVVIDGGRIVSAGGSASSADTVTLARIVSGEIRNVRFESCRGKAAALVGNIGSKLTGNTIIDCEQALYVGQIAPSVDISMGCYVSGNTVENATMLGMKLSRSSLRTTVDHNVFRQAGVWPSNYVFAISSSDDSVVANNTFVVSEVDSPSDEIFRIEPNTAALANNVRATVEHNTFVTTNANVGAFIYLRSQPGYSIIQPAIRHNSFLNRNATNLALAVSGLTADAAENIIEPEVSGNHFENFDLAIALQQTGSGPNIVRPLIYGNTFTNCTQTVFLEADDPRNMEVGDYQLATSGSAIAYLRAPESVGSDKAGPELRIIGGRSTGSGSFGNVSIYGYPAGSAGTNVNTSARVATFHSAGLVVGDINPSSSFGLQVAGNSTRFTDVTTDATTKGYRLGIWPYTLTDPTPCMIYETAGSTTTTLNLGGGTSAMAAVTSGFLYAGAAKTTTTGTAIARWNTSGLTVLSGVLETAGNIELGNASDTTLARSAAGKITVEGVAVALAPAVGTLSYSGSDVTVTAGKGPLQEDTLTATGNFNLLFTGLASRDAGTIFVWPAATNCTVTLPSYAYGPSGTTLTITGGTGNTNHTEIAWKNLVVGGTNRVSVNALNYYR